MILSIISCLLLKNEAFIYFCHSLYFYTVLMINGTAYYPSISPMISEVKYIFVSIYS